MSSGTGVPPPLGAVATSARYEIRRPLGRGGMGAVCAAYDRELGCEVALKRLSRPDPRGVLRFKNEFRLVQGLEHPNLVRLFELGELSGDWFLTMELLDGIELLDYVRLDGKHRAEHRSAADPLAQTREHCLESAAAVASERREPAGQRGPIGFCEDRLRYAFGELARGLVALHGAGLIHRDVKSSNVMVTTDDRVVLLDFGLATELALARQSAEGVIGTAAYMAPEQAASKTVGPAADWYSFGALLYEALTGRLPFVGPPLDVLMRKQMEPPPPPRELVAEVPDDLDQLCCDLLAFAPESRPDGANVLNTLGAAHPAGPASLRSQLTESPVFLGREDELASLHELADSTGNGPVLAHVHGPSGMGKSALVAHFLDAVEARDETAIILRGRCYQNEAVPFKALDGAIDALASALRELSTAERHAVLPRRASLLARLFPVLSRVDAIACAPPLSRHPTDPHEERRWAFSALRELFSHLAERRTVFLVIDDLQWTDRDSLDLLGSLVAPAPPDVHDDEPPALMVITTSHDAQPPILRSSPDLAWNPIEVGPLSLEAATRLARHLLSVSGDAADAAHIAAESEGHPLFVAELARFAAVRPPRPDAHFSLEDAIRDRIDQLPDGPRRVLELLALATAPVPQDALEVATRLEPQALARALALLRVVDLIRSAGDSAGARVVTYHDRIRVAVASNLSPERTLEHHLQLARALEASRRAPDEMVAYHAHAAGEADKAFVFYERAADTATAAMAFDRAADLYGRLLTLGSLGGAQRSAIHTAVGDALAHAGRGKDAADAYTAAIEGADPAEAVRLRNLAAIHLLRSGFIAEGMAGLETVLAEAGLQLPGSRSSAVLSYLLQRARVRLDLRRVQLRAANEVAPADLIRVDALGGAAEGLGWIDGVRAAPLMLRWQRACFRLGERTRVAKALGVEAYSTSFVGVKVADASAALLRRARTVAEELGTPYLDGYLDAIEAMIAQNESRFADVPGLAARAARKLEQSGDVAHFELMTVRMFGLWAQLVKGELASALAGARRMLADANDRSDRWLASQVRIMLAQYLRLDSDDEIARARAEADRALQPWADRDFGFIHFNWLTARVMMALYQGDAQAALELLSKHWPDLRRSGSLRVYILRHFSVRLAGAAHLRAFDSNADPRHLRFARRTGRRMARGLAPWTRAEGHGMLAAADMRCGQLERAFDHLHQAAELFESVGATGPLNQVNWQRGRLVGGNDGERLVRDAEAFFHREGLLFPLGVMRCFGYPDEVP